MISFGSDPEFMLTKDGKFKSAIGVINGSIHNRINNSGHQFYWDNVLAECAIKPSKSKEEAIENFRECFQIYANIAKPYKLLPQVAKKYPKSELQSKEAKEAGCKPDMCAYEMAQKKPPRKEMRDGNLRTCGGHVHLGGEKESVLLAGGAEPFMVLYALDLFLALPSILAVNKDRTEPLRRSLYGQAGRYRVRSYGLEYRSLSNFWLASPDLVGWVYDTCSFAVDFVQEGRGNDLWSFDQDKYFDNICKGKNDHRNAWNFKTYDPKELRNYIDKGEKRKAAKLMKQSLELMPKSLKKEMERVGNRQPKDFYRNWNMK